MEEGLASYYKVATRLDIPKLALLEDSAKLCEPTFPLVEIGLFQFQEKNKRGKGRGLGVELRMYSYTFLKIQRKAFIYL